MREQKQDKKDKGEQEKKGRGRKKQTEANKGTKQDGIEKEKEKRQKGEGIARKWQELTGEKIIEKIISVLERIKPNKLACAFHFSFTVCVHV